jgi:hypothetical protein
MHSFTCFHVENKPTSRNHLCAATLAKRGEQTREANCVKPGKRAHKMVRYPAQSERKKERDERRENSDQQAITQPGEAKHLSARARTHISPHKPILCRGLCGGGVCVAVAVAMDHPSRGFHFPSQAGSIHGDTVPYGWSTCQTIHTSFHLCQPSVRGMVCIGERERRETDATSYVEAPRGAHANREEHIVNKIEPRQTVCAFTSPSP